jgi:integrase/recombinase XerD
MKRAPWEITREMFLEEGEVDALLAHVRQAVETAEEALRPTALLDQLLIEGLLFSGLRNSEFCRLAVGDTVVGSGISAFSVRGAGKEDRTVHVPRGLSDLVRAFVRRTRPALLPDKVAPEDGTQPLVFHERKGPYERTGMYRRVVRILTSAGLAERASVQLLRHTYGYLAYKRTGGNLLFVQRQLGHAHPMVTSVYAQFVQESYETLTEQIHGPVTAAPRSTRPAAGARRSPAAGRRSPRA